MKRELLENELFNELLTHASIGNRVLDKDNCRMIAKFSAKIVTEHLLKDGNELSVSDVQGEHGALHDVRIRNASGQVAEESQTSDELPLGSRTDTENVCSNCGSNNTVDYNDGLSKTCNECGCAFI